MRRELAEPWPPSGARRRHPPPRSFSFEPAPSAARPPPAWLIIRRNKLEPQPQAGGRHALAPTSPLLAVAPHRHARTAA